MGLRLHGLGLLMKRALLLSELFGDLMKLAYIWTAGSARWWRRHGQSGRWLLRGNCRD